MTRRRTRRMTMLRIYAIAIEVLRRLKSIVAEIEKHDRDLARQIKRSSTSVVGNIAEGSGSRAGTRRERYLNALSSARETGAWLDSAVALGYVEAIDPELLDMIDHIRAVLAKNTR